MTELEEQINLDIKERLSEHRYKHSIGVMEKAEELAKFYGLNIEKARLIGLAHDIAKQMTLKEIEEYIFKNNIELDDVEKLSRQLSHAKIGADICKKKYNFDEEMVEAVKCHTTGKINMSMMEKVIFIADKIEENRDYEGIEKRRKLAIEDIDKAIISVMDYTTKECIQRGEMIHPDSINARNYLLKEQKKNKTTE